jgi:hypothetical protein
LTGYLDDIVTTEPDMAIITDYDLNILNHLTQNQLNSVLEELATKYNIPILFVYKGSDEDEILNEIKKASDELDAHKERLKTKQENFMDYAFQKAIKPLQHQQPKKGKCQNCHCH